MKKDKIPRELESEMFGDRRIKFSVDSGGRKRSFALHPRVLLLGAILLILTVALLLIFAWRLPEKTNKEMLTKLQHENSNLQKKIGDYETQIDSVMAMLDTLNIKQPEPEALPSLGEERFGRENPFPVHPGLERKIISLDVKLANLKQRLGLAVEELNADFHLPSDFERSGDGIPAIHPTFGKISSPWGYRMHPIIGEVRLHQGVDISNKTGTPIYATADGVVSKAQDDNGWGKVVNIDHVDDYMTLYAHLSSIKVKVGEVVSKGQIIGLMGNTGMSTGPHLHYGVYRRGNSVDPVPFMNRRDTSLHASAGR
ncbi:MAG: peptidoglycan DD-metalloendopeptidase family protein [Candidatus Cloacimonetes bacterium]|nr:peptidoglycan DD-metalloendopeptidase family protein [Candidatus Cloacimonadota bacterium]